LQVPYELLVLGFVATSGAISTYLDPGVSLALSGVALVVASNAFAYSSYRGRGLPVVVPAVPATVVVYAICRVLALPDYFVDTALLAVLLATLVAHWGTGRVREVFKPAVPIAVLAGVLAGTWVGTLNPLRFTLTPLLEVLAYLVLRSYLELQRVVPYAAATLVALNLNPVTYVNPVLLALSSALYVAKVAVLEVRPSLVPYVVCLDVLLRPTLAGVLG